MAAHGDGATRLGQMLYLWRTLHRQSLDDLSAEIGTSKATLMRIEHGHMCDVETWMMVQRWLFARVGPQPRARKVER